MTYPDRISVMTENLDSYAKAFAELENNEKDLGTWAKAFSETSSEEDAKKFYIKLRVEQLDSENRSEAPRGPIAQGKPDQTTPHSSTTTFIDSEDEQDGAHPYKNMIIVSLGLALLYFLGAALTASQNGIGPFVWCYTAFTFYKKDIPGVVGIQKVMVSIAALIGGAGSAFWAFSNHSPLLYSYVDLIFSALVSFGLHYWFLQHFQRELPDSYPKWSFSNLLQDNSAKTGKRQNANEVGTSSSQSPALDITTNPINLLKPSEHDLGVTAEPNNLPKTTKKETASPLEEEGEERYVGAAIAIAITFLFVVLLI